MAYVTVTTTEAAEQVIQQIDMKPPLNLRVEYKLAVAKHTEGDNYKDEVVANSSTFNKIDAGHKKCITTGKDEDVDSNSFVFGFPKVSILDPSKLRPCRGCGDLAILLCGGCLDRRIGYCSYKCQVRHWPQHKSECGLLLI